MGEIMRSAKDYEFVLPEELVAQEPPEARGGERCDARLVVLHRDTETVEHRVFREVGDFLIAADVLVLNNARVVPTILHGEDADGRPMVLSVFSPMDDGTWHCLAVPASACRQDAGFSAGAGQITGRFLGESDPGVWHVALEPGDPATVYGSAEHIYPGYLKQAPLDPEYYQTAYGSRPGAVLFPSAGRHFTPDMLEALKARGVAVAEVTLFLAARSRYFIRKQYHDRTGQVVGADIDGELPADETGVDFPRAERYEVSCEAAATINERRRAGGRVVVCGTSALRTLETVADPDGCVQPGRDFTRLRIAPGHEFRACDVFLTNLHRPNSSELLLTAALVGLERLVGIYREELIPRGYLFHEFGDSMLIV